MSQTTVNLGHVPVNRGEYSSSATYYKDNIVQYNGSSYICNVTEEDISHPVGISGVTPYDSDPASPNTGWAVFANDSSGVGEGVYNVSVDHTTDNQPKIYASLSAALNDIPAAKKKGGMEIRFIFNNSNYAVDKEEGITTQPAGTLITSSPTMVDGTYKASQLLTYFSTLPTATGAGNAVVYYKEVDGTYTAWTITLQSSDNKYVQYRLMSDSFNTTPANWQGVDDEPTANSNNLVKSGGIDSYFKEKYIISSSKIDLNNSSVNTRNGFINLDGSFTSRSTWRTYDFSSVNIKMVSAMSSCDDSTAVISFLDVNENFISGSVIPGKDTPLTRAIKYYEAIVPNNAAKIQICSYYEEGISVNVWYDCNKTIKDTAKEISKENNTANNTIAYLLKDDAYSVLNKRIKVSDYTDVTSPGSKTWYFLNDAYTKVEVKLNNSISGFLAIAFLDKQENYMQAHTVECLKGEHFYSSDVPDGAKTIIVSSPDLDITPTPDIRIYKNGIIKLLGNSVADITASVLLKDRFKYDETYKGFVRHNSNGSLVSSGGAISLKYKNQGFTYIDIYSTNPAPNDSVPDGTIASFNVVSFYSEGQWLGGQGYMQESSVPAIYGSRKHYKVQIPEGCELILVTLNSPIDNTDTVEIYKDDHSKYLNTIDNLTDVRFLLPPYFTSSYLRNKKNLIEKRIKANAANSDIFIFMTDEHWERGNGHSFSAVKWLDENCNIPRLFSGGDTGHEGINMDFIKIRRKAFSGKIYQTIGNHEYLSYTFDTDGNITEDEVFYGLEMNQGDECIYGNNKRHYYYVDNSIKKIRYIILSAFAQGDGTANSATIGFEQEQLEWFENTALNVNNGWSIIVFTHRLYEGSPSNPANTYIPASCQPVADIIESYAGNGKIIAVFQGHTHYDMIKYLKDGTIPVIITTSDHNGSYRWSESEGKYIRDYDVERESGTINEHAFDVVIIDKVLKRISCIRIGCPARDWSEPEGELVEERIVYWQ